MYNLVKPGISSNLDDRTLHELYLWPFAEGKSGLAFYNDLKYVPLADFEKAYVPALVR